MLIQCQAAGAAGSPLINPGRWTLLALQVPGALPVPGAPVPEAPVPGRSGAAPVVPAVGRVEATPAPVGVGAVVLGRAVAVGRGRSMVLGEALGLAVAARDGVALGVVLDGTAAGPAGLGTASLVRSSHR